MPFTEEKILEMKITLVTERNIIIGTLQSSTSQVRSVQSAVNTTDMTGRDQIHGVAETPLELATAAEYAMHCNPLQDADAPLGVPSTLAVPLETLPPCAKGELLSLVLKVTNVVERNA